MIWNRRVYYDLQTGDHILTTGGFEGQSERYSMDYEFELYDVLKQRTRESIGVLDLQIGEYEEDFNQNNGYKVDLQTMNLLFSYPDPSQPDSGTVYQKPLTDQIKRLEVQNQLLNDDLSGLIDTLVEMGVL